MHKNVAILTYLQAPLFTTVFPVFHGETHQLYFSMEQIIPWVCGRSNEEYKKKDFWRGWFVDSGETFIHSISFCINSFGHHHYYMEKKKWNRIFCGYACTQVRIYVHDMYVCIAELKEKSKKGKFGSAVVCVWCDGLL